MAPRKSLTLFCRVVDNYGDIGICWRLARQLTHERGIAVTLWVDDLRSFKKLCPAIVLDAELQQLEGVTIRHWGDQKAVFSAEQVADIVIEFFGCDILPGYIAAMAQRAVAPVWLNLEGLSAEAWVEGCHTLPSPHPRLPLTKYFYFPGFTSRTGGLLREAGLLAHATAFQADQAAQAQWLTRFGVTALEMTSFKISLFCYPHAPITNLFEAWENGPAAVTCLVFEGVAQQAVQNFLGTAATAGAVRTRGALTLRVLPFVPQPEYDKLLWACDLNLVRGEDSFVRAQWAGKPMIWHIYPQDKDLHHVKLRAFLNAYAGGSSLNAFVLHWNDAASAMADEPADWNELWRMVQVDLPKIAARASAWVHEMDANGDLAGNLLRFASAVEGPGVQKQV